MRNRDLRVENISALVFLCYFTDWILLSKDGNGYYSCWICTVTGKLWTFKKCWCIFEAFSSSSQPLMCLQFFWDSCLSTIFDSADMRSPWESTLLKYSLGMPLLHPPCTILWIAKFLNFSWLKNHAVFSVIICVPQ